MSLIETLAAAERGAERHGSGSGCRACAALDQAEPEEVREALRRAMAGTIGLRRLAEILRDHDIPVGRTVLERHRKEGHR